MKVKELIEELQKLPQDDEIIITAMDNHFSCDKFEVASEKSGESQEIILGVYIDDYSTEPEDYNESLIVKLNQQFNLDLKEFYDVDPDEKLEMRIVSYGKEGDVERFELDGIEFFKADDEELKNAIEVCIDMEFLPEWEKNNNISSYNVDSIFYDEEDGEGTAYVTVFGEGADEE